MASKIGNHTGTDKQCVLRFSEKGPTIEKVHNSMEENILKLSVQLRLFARGLFAVLERQHRNRGIKMPDKEVETIRDLIFYQYAKIIARSAFEAPDGKAAKSQHYGFIKNTFRQLKSGQKSWSEITREDKQLVQSENRCAYCGSDTDLNWEHLVPRSISINERCPTCEHILEIHNQVLACRTCNSLKGKRGLYDFYQTRFPQDPKFYDMIPPLLEKKYLKTIYNCHDCASTLDSSSVDASRGINVLDIDSVLRIKGAP